MKDDKILFPIFSSLTIRRDVSNIITNQLNLFGIAGFFHSGNAHVPTYVSSNYKYSFDERCENCLSIDEETWWTSYNPIEDVLDSKMLSHSGNVQDPRLQTF